VNKSWRRFAPWAAAWFTPSAVLAVVLLATGQNPAAGLAYGWLGALGAVAFTVTRSWLRRRTALTLLKQLNRTTRIGNFD
jgi:hypothetical protein